MQISLRNTYSTFRMSQFYLLVYQGPAARQDDRAQLQTEVANVVQQESICNTWMLYLIHFKTMYFLCLSFFIISGFPDGSGKESICQCRRLKRHRFDPWVGKIPWRRKWQPTPIFLPGEPREQRSRMGYSPKGLKESDTTEHLSTSKYQHLSTTQYLTLSRITVYIFLPLPSICIMIILHL